MSGGSGGFPAGAPVAQGGAGPPWGAFLQTLNNINIALNAQTTAIKAIAELLVLETKGSIAGAGGIVLGGYAHGVNLNATGDTAITLSSPAPNFTVDRIVIRAVSGAQGAAGFGAYSSAAQGGFSWSGGQVASTLASIAPDAANGIQTIAGAAAAFSADSTIYFNVGTAQGAASTANVYVFLRPLP